MTPHKVGEIEIIKYRWNWRDCEKCDLPARYCLTYLLRDSRHNPSSSGYRKDDISWCADESLYACQKHERDVERETPDEMSFCSSFQLKRFKHMGFYKTVIK